MEIKFWLNGKKIQAEIQADTLLLDLLREKECYSVKRGCETANCGLCTVLLEEKHVVTLEGLQEKAEELGSFLAGEGAEQCGFCNPGFMMNIFAMEKELTDPTEEEINEYLAGNLCRCSGFMGQTRSILKYLEYKKTQREGEGQ